MKIKLEVDDNRMVFLYWTHNIIIYLFTGSKRFLKGKIVTPGWFLLMILIISNTTLMFMGTSILPLKIELPN